MFVVVVVVVVVVLHPANQDGYTRRKTRGQVRMKLVVVVVVVVVAAVTPNQPGRLNEKDDEEARKDVT